MGVALPVMIWCITASMSALSKSTRSTTRLMACLMSIVSFLDHTVARTRPTDEGRRRQLPLLRSRPLPHKLLLQEISQQVMAVLGQDRFRMKLHAFNLIFLVAHAHDFIAFPIGCLGPGGYFQAIRQAVLIDD